MPWFIVREKNWWPWALGGCQEPFLHGTTPCRIRQAGIPCDDVLAAVRVGLMVNHGAAHAIRKHADKLVGEIATEIAT